MTDWVDVDHPAVTDGQAVYDAQRAADGLPAWRLIDYWENDGTYLVADWQFEVAEDNTRLGYHDWVEQQKSLRDDEEETPSA